MSTRADLRGKVRTEIKIDPNGKIWSDSVLNQYVSTGYFQIQKDGNFKWRPCQANNMFSTVVGTQEYSLPTDFIRTSLVRYNGTRLYKTEKDILKAQYTSFVSGIPSEYYLYTSKIGFDVLPSAVGTIDLDYSKRLASLTTDASASELPEDFDDLIAKYATYLAFSTTRGYEVTAQAKLNDYKLMIDTMFNAYIFDDVVDLNFRTIRGGSTLTRPDVLDR